MAGLGAALSQIYIFKPVVISVSPVFLLLLNFALGKLWEKLVYVPHTWLKSPWVIKRWTAKTLLFLNPGNFGLKEVSSSYPSSHKDVQRALCIAHCSNACSNYGSLWLDSCEQLCSPTGNSLSFFVIL